MNKQRPSSLAMVTMVAFTASCIGLLIFLWISFGGTLPFAAQGYRFSTEFSEATELAANAQVTIAGVKVGHVVSVTLDHRTGLDRAVIEIDNQYAPRPAGTRAILRQKSLLGETYVQLSAGNPRGRKLRDGGVLPRAQVAKTVQLDQILNTFSPRTRAAFQTWMQQGGIALSGRGQQFNAALADLYPFAQNVDSVLAVLNRDSAATRTLLENGGQVFSALSSSPSQLQSFVTNSNRLFSATSARDVALADTIRAFPGFLRQSATTVKRLTRFSANAKPLIDELHPAALQLNPALKSVDTLAPELKTLFTNVGPLTKAARTGFPALRTFLNQSVPFLTALKPYLGNIVPVINYLNVYRRELAGFFANSAASTQARSQAAGNKDLHYLRISNPLNPEILMPYAKRPETNRSNPYIEPGAYNKLLKGLPSFGSYLCTHNPLPAIGASLDDPSTETSIAGTMFTLGEIVRTFLITTDPSGPACNAQAPLAKQTTGHEGAFPSLTPLP